MGQQGGFPDAPQPQPRLYCTDDPRIYVAKLDLEANLMWGHLFESARVETRPALGVTSTGEVYLASNLRTEQLRNDHGILTGVQIATQLFKLDREGNVRWSQRVG